MRIIKQGELPKEEKEVTCSKCKTTFAYTKNDVKPDFRDGDYVICPICQSWINDK